MALTLARRQVKPHSTMAAPLFSTLFGDASLWTAPDPAYPDIANLTDGASTRTRNEVRQTIANLSARSPAVLAFTIDSEPDHVCVGHTPAFCPADHSHAAPFDDQLAVLVGDDSTAVIPIVLPADAFTRTAPIRALDLAHIAAGCAATPRVDRSGPHGAGAAHTDELRARAVAVMPSSIASQVVSARADGRFTLQGFHTDVLEPLVTGPNGTSCASLKSWFRVASTASAPAALAGAVAPPSCS